MYICLLKKKEYTEVTEKPSSSTSSDPPATPTLTAEPATVFNGGVVTLTCASATSSIDSYEFLRDGNVLAVGSDNQASQSFNTYRINSAEIGTHDGSYTCRVYRNTVVSALSSAYALSSK